MKDSVVVAGVGMTAFQKPGQSPSYIELGAEAIRAALADAGVDYDSVQQAYAGWVFADSAAGQAALYGTGLTGIPIVNVNNNCASGATALFLAQQAVRSGAVDCALAFGFEQMPAGAIKAAFSYLASPIGRFLDIADARFPDGADVPMAIRLFAAAGFEYQEKYGTANDVFAKIRVKASRHARHNDRAVFRNLVSVEEVLASPPLFLNLTRLQACPPTCGAAAALVCSEKFAREHGVPRGVRIRAQAMTTDGPSTFTGTSMMDLVGADMARRAARAVYDASGVSPQEVDVVELHDCFTVNEVITYEALGLCEAGGAEKFIEDGDNTYSGRTVTNPSGGLLCKGHPLGATGLAQCFELVSQLRGQAGSRQVEGARLALQHNLGIGGACVVSLYERI